MEKPSLGKETLDLETAQAFASSWNNLPLGSVYTREQFEDWMAPLTQKDIEGKKVLELGCGNASLLVHMAQWKPSHLVGVDLGDSVISAKKNMAAVGDVSWSVEQADILRYREGGYDVSYCIGVLHHLKVPEEGFVSLVQNTKSGGKFHAWVYAREGNGVIVYIVDPIRKIVSHLPWWFTKYFVATPLVIPYFIYAKIISRFENNFVSKLPLYEYSRWISKREFSFFRHVAFDQLVTPQTAYLSKATLEEWLKNPLVDQSTTYVIMRNGNSWKFGGARK